MKELRYLNIGYMKNLLTSDIINYLSINTKHSYNCDKKDDFLDLVREKNINLIITTYDLELLKNIREIDKKIQILILCDDVKDQYLIEAAKLEYVIFLSKEVSKNELIINLKKCIRNLDSNSSNILALKNDYIFDLYNHTILRNESVVSLSKKEISFLGFMLNNLNRVMSYDEINKQVWNGTMTNDALRSIVKELRKKLYKELIKNISGVGYRIDLI